MEIAIYSDSKNSRVTYAARELFRYSNVDDIVWLDDDALQTCELPIINYSHRPVDHAICHIKPHPVMTVGYRQRQAPMQLEERDGVDYWFQTSEQASVFAFDILALCFWSLTCYEEAIGQPSGTMNRHAAQDHPLSRYDRLQVPHVELWKRAFAAALRQATDSMQLVYTFPDRHALSVDIDQAWAFENKPLIRQWIGFGRDLIRWESDTMRARFDYLLRGEADPFDTYDAILDTADRYGIDTHFFVLLSDGRGIDKSYSPRHPEVRKLIRHLDQRSKVGIHFSAGTASDSSLLQKECRALESILDKPVEASRQHYLQLRWPTTYRSLLDVGITADHTMGYHDGIGYRAGTACPFAWYDLTSESATPLMVHPFFAMDAAFKNQLQRTPQQTLGVLSAHIKFMRANRLPIVLLWHNSSMSPLMGWDGWASVPYDIMKILGDG